MAWVICINALIIWAVLVYFEWDGLAIISFCVAVVSGIVGLETSDWSKERDRQYDIAQRAAATPHVIREAAGCQVYAFTTDREHYFTRCGSTVSTETNWSKSCGKNCTKQDSDTIITEGNK